MMNFTHQTQAGSQTGPSFPKQMYKSMALIERRALLNVHSVAIYGAPHSCTCEFVEKPVYVQEWWTKTVRYSCRE